MAAFCSPFLSPFLSYTIRIENLAILAGGNTSAGLRVRRDDIGELLPTVLLEAPSSVKVDVATCLREITCLRGLAQHRGSVSVCSLPSTPSLHMFTAMTQAGIPFKLSAANLLHSTRVMRLGLEQKQAHMTMTGRDG